MTARQKPDAVVASLRRLQRFLTLDNWTKGHEALDDCGAPVPSTDPAAVRFCVQGALLRLSPDLGPDAFKRAMRFLNAAARAVAGRTDVDLFTVNDALATEFPTVRAIVRHALAGAQADRA